MGARVSISTQRKQRLMTLLLKETDCEVVSEADQHLRFGEVAFMQHSWTLMHLAVWLNRGDLVKRMGELKFDVNVADISQYPLHSLLILTS
jgi:hypothetical protein